MLSNTTLMKDKHEDVFSNWTSIDNVKYDFDSGIEYHVIGDMSEEECKHYIKQIADKCKPAKINRVSLIADNEDVDIGVRYSEDIPFDRIRRITGYLVGTLDRFNDAKRAEVEDRVKHNVRY